MNPIDTLRARQTGLTELRRALHSDPELAFAEHNTSAEIARRLEALGIETHRGIGRTGVVGVLRAGSSKRAIGLRADMDALPITERNQFAHRSRNPGRMHACGHDGHTTMLIAAAEVFSERRNFDGTVYLIFQPAEEGEGGAPAMLCDGLLERFPMDALFGMHNWPGLAAGSFAIHDGPMMACADRFDIELRGHGAHAAMPHLGRDPVVAGAALVQSLQSIASRVIDPLQAAVVSVTQFHAGEAYNVIADRATMSGTVRVLRPELQDQVEAELQRICAGISAAHGVEVDCTYTRGYPPTVNSAAETAVCARVAAELAGEEAVRSDLPPSMGAEDFAFFLQQRPGAYIWIGNGPGAGGCMLHNPQYDFNDDIIPLGGAYWVRLAETVLAPE